MDAPASQEIITTPAQPAAEAANPLLSPGAAFPVSPVGVLFRILGFLIVLNLSALPYAIVKFIVDKMTLPPGVKATVDLMSPEHLREPYGFLAIGLLQLVILLPVILATATFEDRHWRTTLAVKAVSLRQLLKGMGLLVLVLIAEAVFDELLDVEDQDFMLKMNGVQNWGLAFLLVLVAPLMEELIFRGYAFSAWRHSRLGLTGTLLLTSAIWSALHVGQYSFLPVVFLFFYGFFLGWMREKTGSVLIPIALHALSNLVPTVAVVFLGLAGQ